MAKVSLAGDRPSWASLSPESESLGFQPWVMAHRRKVFEG